MDSNQTAPNVNAEKDGSQKVITDLVNFELKQKEIYYELLMKTDKIEQLQKDLDTVNLQLLKTNTNMENLKRKNEQLEYKLDVATKNTNFLENKLKEKYDLINNNRLCYDLVVSEKNSLHKLIECAEIEKLELTKKIEEMKTQHEYDQAVQKELMDQDSKIRNAVSELKVTITKLESEQGEVLKISQTENIHESLSKSLQFYKQEVSELKNINRELEKTLTYYRAKCDNFEKLLEKHQTENESSLTFKEWQKCSEHHKKQMKFKDEIIDKLTANLRTEKEANKKLTVNDHCNRLQLEEMQKTLNAMVFKDTRDTETQTEEDLKICKIEVVEID